MMLFVLTLLFFVAAMALMAVGLALGRGPLPGSCAAQCRCRSHE
jgi:hypothetical protein